MIKFIHFTRKTCFTSILLLVFLLTLPLTVCAENNIKARGVMLMNWDKGTVLYEQNADSFVPPASLTKVLTMYIAFDAIKSGKISLRDKVKISKNAAGQKGSRMGLVANETVTLEQLMLGMAVSSGNDAAVAVAEYIAGSHNAFVKQMNKKAKKLGMTKSVFYNASGMPAKGQKTTARDMAKLTSSYLTVHPEGLRFHQVTSLKHRKYIGTNKNTLLTSYNGADGLKTGWTKASGYNIITTVRRGKTRLVAVVLGASDSKVREKETKRLLDAGFAYSQGKSSTMAQALSKKRG